MKEKVIIYQLLPRLFGNTKGNQVFNGTIVQNGCGKFNDITDKVIIELKNSGITHIWLTGIIRHTTRTDYPDGLKASHPDIVKGNAGSPYAINDYYDVDPDLAIDVSARMQEFQSLIHRIHSLGLKAIIDFVPNHVARDYHSAHLPAGTADLGERDTKTLSFSPRNNFYYFPGQPFSVRGLTVDSAGRYVEMPARATGNNIFRNDPDIHDWYETVKLNYGFDYQTGSTDFFPIPDTWIRMTEILLFWSFQGVDGFRCDMAGMVPVDFWQYSISQVKGDYPEMMFLAELYEPRQYRNYLETGLFDYLYDKVGWYDAVRRVITDNAGTQVLSGVWQALEGMDDQMLRFLENHDEQRIASRFFAGDARKALPGMALAAFMNNGPVMVYSGQEVGEPATGAAGFSGDDGRTSIFDYTVMPEIQKWFNHGKCDGRGLSEYQRNLRKEYIRIVYLAKQFPAFANGGFYDLMWVNEDIPHRDRIYSFLRYGGDDKEGIIVVTVCFNPEIRETAVRIPEHALTTTGLGVSQRYTITSIEPSGQNPETFLLSQLTVIGIKIRLNDAGYSLLSIT